MNGARTTFMRRGYLLTALAAVVLLAASPGTASAQNIGFDASSGSVMETAFVKVGGTTSSEHPPLEVKISVTGLPPVGDAGRVIANILGTVNVTQETRNGPTLQVYRVVPPVAGVPQAPVAVTTTSGSETDIASAFANADEVTLLVAPGLNSETPDANWIDDEVVFTLASGQAGVVERPNQVIVTVTDEDVAPIVKFDRSSVNLDEDTDTTLALDVMSGSRLARMPPALATDDASVSGGPPFANRNLRLSITNPKGVSVAADGVDVRCPSPSDPTFGRKALYISANRLDDAGATTGAQAMVYDNVGGTIEFTGVTVTTLAGTVAVNAAGARTNAGGSIELRFRACGNDDFRDMGFELGFDNGRLSNGGRHPGDVTAGDAAMISIGSNDAGPTLSFSPTDVTIDEGGETSTVLIAEGPNATDVGMVKLMVEGDAMVDLYQDGAMLEEMDGYVMVDLGGNNNARLTAMSTSDPDLMDGDMAYKAWKLMEDSADGVNIGDGYWFRVDVNGSTAVPALPLVGQLLLALFLMAGGSRLYRRRRG